MALKKSVVKGGDGKVSNKRLAVGGSQATPTKARPLDKEAQAHIAAGREKAAEKRRKVTNEKKATSGMTSLGSVMQEREMSFINKWLSERPYMVSHCSGLMRNGLMEQSYQEQQVQSAPTSQLGKKLVGDIAGTAKWRHLSATTCIFLLQNILPPGLGLADWFRGEDKLPVAMAAKALAFALGVTANTALPQGHKHCQYAVPLIWLAKQRWDQLGQRLSTTSKQTLDADSDYFVIGRGNQVVLNVNKKPALSFKFDLNIAKDWVITDPENYLLARLVSEDTAMDTLLARVWEKENDPPTYDSEFHFPERGDGGDSDLDFEAEKKSDAQQKADLAAMQAIVSHDAAVEVAGVAAHRGRPGSAEVMVPPIEGPAASESPAASEG